ncbi:MAG: ABC transporter ATP-binding protein [Lachnospiraceae bacterium]|nr:ABC transporter ATP-binding protein [Lachnospiraceae bacterium]
MSYSVETKGLTVGYNGKALIKDISLSIRPGEIITMIGPNGSGKSTILKSLTRHLATIGGTVHIGEDELGRMSYKDLSKRVAVVLTRRINPELMTCRDVVATGRYPYTGRMGLLSDEDEAIVTEAMKDVNILEISNRSFDGISDGQRQRVLLARAICQQPEILVLDEPTSFLDIKYKIELLEILRRMSAERGTTVIMSLHEIDLAAKVSSRIICVHGDRIAAFGPPEEIFRDGMVEDLYSLDEGRYNRLFGSVELPRPVGEPRVFVISAGGSGITVYRQLQKMGIPFAAGILYPNDADYQVARSLATKIVEAEPFEPMSEAAYEEALAVMKACGSVIVCPTKTGSMTVKLRDLMEKAKEMPAFTECPLIMEDS